MKMKKIFKKEYEFVQHISDPIKAGEWWDSLFKKIVEEVKGEKV